MTMTRNYIAPEVIGVLNVGQSWYMQKDARDALIVGIRHVDNKGKIKFFDNSRTSLPNVEVGRRREGSKMPIKVSKDDFLNIREIWGYGPNTIVIYTVDGRHIKITAAQNIKSGSATKYSAEYEEMKEVKIGDKTIEVWVNAHYPWRDGDTVEECLLGALALIDLNL